MNTLRLDFLHRMGACLLNYVAIFLIALFASLLFSVADWVEGLGEKPGQLPFSFMNRADSTITLFMLFVVAINEALEAFGGYNFGKLILRMRIGTADGRNGSVKFYILRYLAKNIFLITWGIGMGLTELFTDKSFKETFGIIQTLFTMICIIGYFFALWKGRQALHDIVAKSAVYKAADLS